MDNIIGFFCRQKEKVGGFFNLFILYWMVLLHCRTTHIKEELGTPKTS